MKKQTLVLLAVISLGLFLTKVSPSGFAQKSGYGKAAFPIYAEGVQVYQCKAGTTQWELKEPKADLYDDSGKKIGTHFKDAGGPAWQSEANGKPTSKVVADTEKRSIANDPLDENIPMLWLGVKTSEGAGMFGKIKSIQRVNTVGGKAPAGNCVPNKDTAVKYTATYYFYVDNR